MRLALDAMGGDDAPRAMVDGALHYARSQPQHQVILVGPDTILRPLLTDAPANIVVEHAPDVIGMADKLSALKERPDNSINRCTELLKLGKADGLVLCGNTGCSVVAAQLNLRRIPGVKRAGLLAPLPKPTGHTWVCDVGANNINKPEHLVQFAEMTAAFLASTIGKTRPKIGVLSNGEEDEKGIELTHETLALLRKTDLNVVGQVEGHHLYTTDIDVVVCDGFVGNIVLKTSEGVENGLRKIIKEEIGQRFWTKLGGLLVRPAFEGVRRRVDWRFVGGSPLLGVDGLVIKGHGRSDKVAIYHALKQAAAAVEGGLIAGLRRHFASGGSEAA
ncbi:MAG TPA: phosphate acyltransferase PlsX [Planctomycetota bacterium]|nr:phosphate acyltransferase PlsX [Planctomycetota bacterium]